MRPVPVRAVTMGEGGYWTRRMKANAETSIPALMTLFETNGFMDNYRRVSAKKDVARKGPMSSDSNIYKWIEAAASVLQSGPNPAMQAELERVTREVLAVQELDGYLNTYWIGDLKSQRFTRMPSGGEGYWGSHEEYCLGHLIQAAVASYRATGDRRLLDASVKFADYMVDHFGPDKRPAVTGHPELEMAMVELYRSTGNRRYLDFAGYLLSGVEKERLHLTDAQIRYMCSGRPFATRTQFDGHAVRSVYAACGAADYYAETGDPAYLKALDKLWCDMVAGKMYITGGIGSRSEGEAFGKPYELPNAIAYNETCAAVGNVMWNWRMLGITAEARFADVLEQTLYNGAASGMSNTGTLFTYRNPLETSGAEVRKPWFSTPCCQPNIQRLIAQFPGYIYGTSDQGIYVNLYADSALDWRLHDGTPIRLEQRTKYPWDGAIDLTLRPGESADFALHLRIPAWSKSAAIHINDEPFSGKLTPGEYVALSRHFNPGDRVRLDLDVRPRVVASHPELRENTNRVALQLGPVVYCLEQRDLPGSPSLADVAIAINPDGAVDLRADHRPDFMGGVSVLRAPGLRYTEPIADNSLYHTLNIRRRPSQPIELTFIPYSSFNSRGPSPMQVWVARDGTN